MRLRAVPLLYIARCVTAATIAGAQTFPVKNCDSPKEPLGVIRAQGQVAYVMKKDGRVDTGTVRVVSLRGIGARGLRSAAVRQLAGCRFDRSSDTSTAEVVVVDALGFDSATIIVTPATVVAPTIVTLPLEGPPKVPDTPVDVNDSTLEERPRRLACDRQADVPEFTGFFRTRQDRDAAFAAWQRQNSGVLKANIVINAEGRVMLDATTVTSSTNPAMNGILVGVLASCRYVPGRIAGVPISTTLATRTGIGAPSGP